MKQLRPFKSTTERTMVYLKRHTPAQESGGEILEKICSITMSRKKIKGNLATTVTVGHLK